MDAGTGAQQQARRHEERLVALEAERAGLDAARAAVDAAQSALDVRIELTRRQHRAWSAGAEGERRVGAHLDALGPGWRVLHDVRWPGRKRANLDHVVVGPTGVWVLDAKNWSGPVSVRDGVLRCGRWRKVRQTEAVAAGAEAVANLLQPPHRPLVRPVVCLAGSGAELALSWTPSGTRVVGLAALTETLTTPPACLQPLQVDAVADHLLRELGGRTGRTGRAPVVARIPAQASRRGSRGPAAGVGGPPAPASRPARARSGARAAVAELLATLLKMAAFLVLTAVLVQTLPLWGPPLERLVSQVVVQPMIDRITDRTASTAPAP